ncbi:MAG: hypothetical protein MUC56_17235, partial [Thermoanaerobaculales bacterium]|nr:hypothetical protein [Thermoanaerobaculales bacterium]
WLVAMPIASAAAAEPGDGSMTAGPAELIEMSFRGISPALRDLPAMNRASLPDRTFFDLEAGEDAGRSAFDDKGVRYGTGTAKVPDGSISPPVTDGDEISPDLAFSFEGLSSIVFGPPDPEGAVGPDHYVQVVNIQLRVFDKRGTPVTEPVLTNSIWAGSGGICESDLFADAVVAYDRLADRWVLVHLAAESGLPIACCMAVSTSGDPTGDYYLYELETPLIPDYPKLGVWPDTVHNAYVVSTLVNTDPRGRHDVFALDRASLLAGVVPRPARRFTGYPNLLMPADLDGARPAPAGSAVPLYTFRDGGESYFVPPTPVDTLDLYELRVDWDQPDGSSLVLVQSLEPPELAEFNWTLCGWDQPECLPQPGTSRKLDSISWIPMQRLQYRNLGAYEALAGVWTVNAVVDGIHAAPRWFELRRFGGGAWVMAHQGTYAPTPSHRWMASVALDGSGNMAMVYNVVNAGIGLDPSLYYSVRRADSPFFLAERSLAGGRGPQTGLDRWGDYSSMEVDPADDCTFWFTGEYMPARGESSWSTRVGVLRVPGCTGQPGPASAVIAETRSD